MIDETTGRLFSRVAANYQLGTVLIMTIYLALVLQLFLTTWVRDTWEYAIWRVYKP